MATGAQSSMNVDISRMAKSEGQAGQMTDAALAALDKLLAKEIPKVQALHAAIRKERKRRAKRAAA